MVRMTFTGWLDRPGNATSRSQIPFDGIEAIS